MIRQWTQYKSGPNKRGRGEAHVTLNCRGVFFINKHAIEMMGRPEAVQLFYDERHAVIGLRPSEPDAQFAFPLKVMSGGESSRILSASGFCSRFKIKPTSAYTIAFPRPEIDHDGILLLDIHSAVETKREKAAR